MPTDTPGKYVVYAISWDGRLRTVDPATGREIARAEPFLPPNGKPYSLNFTTTFCTRPRRKGAAARRTSSTRYDLATKKVGSFNPGSGGMWPRLGPSIGKDGSVYAGSGDGDYFPERQIYGQSIVAVKQNPETKALEMTDWYTPSNAYWLRKRDLDINATGPVFEYKGKEYTVQTSKECRVWLLETAASAERTTGRRTTGRRSSATRKCNSPAPASGARSPRGRKPNGTRWILVPFWGPKHSQFTAPIEHGAVVQGAVAAFKMEETAGSRNSTPAWLSRNMWQADPVVIANGVVFAYGNGEDAAQATFDGGLGYNTSANRIAQSGHATLYALDARTGAELWSSGDQITSFSHFSSLAVANGRVYLGTYDGTLYCFGVKPTAAK